MLCDVFGSNDRLRVFFKSYHCFACLLRVLPRQGLRKIPQQEANCVLLLCSWLGAAEAQNDRRFHKLMFIAKETLVFPQPERSQDRGCAKSPSRSNMPNAELNNKARHQF